ncbi:MAG: hypothetical protein FWC34_05790 [Bacteroidetes bacterium]|nr:hypothetical protein [Bacteroidota bacterium]MCL2301771.1 hypothetical protein [Lentimicrobiaceae bacterium]
MKKIFVIAISLLFVGVAFSQPIDTARFRLDFTPSLQNFHKITQPALIPDEMPEPVNFEYEIAPQAIDLSFSPAPIKPVKFPGDVMKKLYRNFLKVGFGYPVTPLGELCIHNFDNSKFSYGLNVNHISGWAPPIGKEMKKYAYAPFSDTRAHLFFNTFFRNQTLYSSIGYNHNVAHLFGFNRDNTPESLHKYYEKEYRYLLKNNFQHLYAEVGLRSNFLPEDAKLKQDVRLNYNFIHAINTADMENHIGVASIFAYDVLFRRLNGFFRPQLDFNVDYYLHSWQNDFKFVCDPALCSIEHEQFLGTTNSFKIEFIPTVKFAVREYHLRLGLGVPIINSLDANMQGTAKCPVFPVAELQLGIVPGILSIYAGVDGNVKYNSLKDLLYENPFLKTGLDSLRFSRTQISIFGGVKGNLVKKLNYHVSGRYSYTQDMAFFFLDTASRLKNKFDVVYANVNWVNVCANLNWQVVNKLYLNLEANYWGYFNYEKFIAKPWYKPNFEVAFAGKYYLKEKYIFDLNMKLGFGSYALKPRLEEDRMVYLTERMNPILNFGVGFEYLITKRFSCFATVNNLGFQNFAKYYNFNNVGFNAILGITYSFGDENLRRTKK